MTADRSEPALAEFWTSYVDGDRRGSAFAVRHPGRLWSAVRTIRRLPVIDARPSDSPGGRAIRATLETRGPLGVPARVLGAAVLTVPADPQDHVTGRSAQTLRRKIRSAGRAGVTVRTVTDVAEKLRLIVTADDMERNHPDAAYRVPHPRNFDLLDHDLWLVACDHEGTPLLLSVTPVDGDLATLRYFRTLGRGPAHSDSRYLMTHALVVELSRRGVRWLLDTDPPGTQKNGLRHFQRMVGFRYARVRLHRAAKHLALAVVPAYLSVETLAERVSALAAF